MQELYDDMKDALAFFGVRFHNMGDVKVRALDDGRLEFEHEGRRVSLDVTPREADD